MHNDDYCAAYVQTEAWADPGGTPHIVTNGKGQAVWAQGVLYTGAWGTVYGSSKHWYVNWMYPSGGWQWIQIDVLSSSAFLGWNPEDIYDCEVNQGGNWHYETGSCDIPSPIMIDLDGKGYHLTSPSLGVAFDIDADGVLEATAWTEADSSNAFLVLDRNGNGVIDDGRELFGTATPSSGGSPASNGFAALTELDSNRDGLIDSGDQAYSDLRLWTDINHNGLSEVSELRTASDAGVSAIYLAYEVIGRRDRHGNLFRLKGRALVARKGVARPRSIFDVYLLTQ